MSPRRSMSRSAAQPSHSRGRMIGDARPVAYLAVKYLHVLGATVILGTGAGIAFFMLMAHRSHDARFIARTAGVVVKADLLFTATAVAAQPVTGFLLLRASRIPVTEGWMMLSLCSTRPRASSGSRSSGC